MIPRRALAFFLLAVAAFGALLALRRLAPQRAAVAGPAAPPASALELFGGAFRPIVADALWARLLAHYEARRFEEMLPVAEALLSLDPRFERAWWVTASTAAIDIPAFEEDVAVRWRWRRQGFALLREGIAHNPRSWYLRLHDGVLAQLTSRDAALAERLRADRALNPAGLAPLDYACARFLEAQAIEPHGTSVDRAVESLGCK